MSTVFAEISSFIEVVTRAVAWAVAGAVAITIPRAVARAAARAVARAVAVTLFTVGCNASSAEDSSD